MRRELQRLAEPGKATAEPVDFTRNYFELFDLPVGPWVDLQLLNARYRELQRRVHPDRHVASSAHEQHLALQYATLINEAYQVLGSNLKRFAYLLQLRGVEVPEQALAEVEPQFLLQQIELRECLEEIPGSAAPQEELERLHRRVAEGIGTLEQAFAEAIAADDEQALRRATALVQKLQYLGKIAQEIDRLESALFDGAVSIR